MQLLKRYRPGVLAACFLLASGGAGPSIRVQARIDPPPPSTLRADSGHSHASLHEKIGLVAARRRLGIDLPTGRGVVMGHVEGGGGDHYLPNAHDNSFRGVTFIRRSGVSKVSGHATATARILYGARGLAPGVRVVNCFSAKDWLEGGYLRVGSAQPPVDGLPSVFNDSWIAKVRQGAEQVLARVDYQVDRRNVIMCVGVNNGRGTPVPPLLASAYNVIAVGVASGDSSGGYTTVAGKGRCKPDLAAPKKLTSFATPVVSACAARLLEAARDMNKSSRVVPDDADAGDAATRSEVIKAVMMAGATKPADWKVAPGKPLDEHLGAGVVNLDNSLLILQTGPATPGKLRHRYGWSFHALDSGGKALYRFKTTQSLGPTSILLTWNRHVRGVTTKNPETGKPIWLGLPTMTDFDLRLIRLDESSGLTTLATSESSIDNVEHVYLPKLSPGRYVIEVRREQDQSHEPWPYALAWRAEQATK